MTRKQYCVFCEEHCLGDSPQHGLPARENTAKMAVPPSPLTCQRSLFIGVSGDGATKGKKTLLERKPQSV